MEREGSLDDVEVLPDLAVQLGREEVSHQWNGHMAAVLSDSGLGELDQEDGGSSEGGVDSVPDVTAGSYRTVIMGYSNVDIADVVDDLIVGV